MLSIREEAAYSLPTDILYFSPFLFSFLLSLEIFPLCRDLIQQVGRTRS